MERKIIDIRFPLPPEGIYLSIDGHGRILGAYPNYDTAYESQRDSDADDLYLEVVSHGQAANRITYQAAMSSDDLAALPPMSEAEIARIADAWTATHPNNSDV